MYSAAYSTQIPSRRPSRTRSIFALGALSGRFLVLVALAVLALLYIAQASQGATKRVTAQELGTKAEELNQQQNQLKFEALRMQSFDSISSSADSLGLESVTSVEHLK